MDSALSRCPECGVEMPPSLLSCPSCGRLLHAATLKKLAAAAEAAEQAGDLPTALTTWRDALELLPPDTRQHATILQRIQTLSARVDEGVAAAPSGSGLKKGAAGLGGLALLLFKFKSVGLLILTKGKFILLGLTKAPTLFSMLLSMWYYLMFWGWKFVIGFLLCLYIHEMGHVWMLRRYGIRATAPMFIPGFGALVRLEQYPVTVIEDARTGLAGPLWGLGAAAICYAVYIATGLEYWGALAQSGGIINLFNLIPIWQLDGGRGLKSLTKGQRVLLALAVGATYYFTLTASVDHEIHRQNVLLAIIGISALVRAFAGDTPKQRDDFGLFQFVLLIITLGALASIDIPMAARMR